MAKRNVALEIGVSLAAAVLFGVGMYVYLDRTMERPTPIAMVKPSSQLAEAETYAEHLRSLAPLFGNRIVNGDYTGVLDMMALPVRQRVTVERMREVIEGNPYFALIQSITILRTTEQRIGDTSSTARSTSTFRATGVLALSNKSSVEIVMHFVREDSTLKIASVIVAGVPVLPPAQ